MAQPPDDQGSFDEESSQYVPEDPIERPDNSCHRLSSLVAVMEGNRRFSAVLPKGGSAIASSSQPLYCSNSN